MELKDFGLVPNTNYNGQYEVKRKGEDGTYFISRTSNKIIFYWDEKGTERRLFLKKVEEVKEAENIENVGDTPEQEEEDDGPGGEFDAETLRNEANRETFLFSSEENPFFNNDFIWATETDFVKDNDLMFQ